MIAKRNKIRVAKYKRVSTDEQKLKKNSIIAQDEILDEYIKNNPDMVLVGDFSDEGVSGSKIKRTELQRLLELVEAREVDLILVTKLDRWFRNVAFYYKVQEILEKNNVAWKAILEDYNTLTADGKLKVNIMLSVAQNEVERTSERIKVVFESKVKHKQAISGNQPIGYTTAPGNGARMVIKDKEYEPIVHDLIDLIFLKQSIRGALIEVNKKYDIDLTYGRVNRLITSTMLYGEYQGVIDYCPAYVTKEKFQELQRIIDKNIKYYNVKSGEKHTYYFTGLMTCPVCGRRMAGAYVKNRQNGKIYYYKYYRCSVAKLRNACSYKKAHSENVLERKLLEQLSPQFENLLIETEIEEKKAKVHKVNKSAIKEQMARLNSMYLKGRIDDEEYDKKYKELEDKIKDVKKVEKKDYGKLKEMLDGDFKSLYKTFNEEEKQMFWRSIIDSFTFENGDIVIKFL